MLENITTWKILGIVAIVAILISIRKRSAIWGGFTVGSIIGIIAGFFKDGNYDWYYVAKYAIVGTLIGLFADILGIISVTLRRKN